MVLSPPSKSENRHLRGPHLLQLGAGPLVAATVGVMNVWSQLGHCQPLIY
ncbi:uncharacterized protein LACBIDRAFT_302188 [Laccaria bicolor S238N-H82]|uniref:Predicted protein n=1 Tax=Laccaria bicolor (strain S238N-H82 / ATCC MYA-4686) TaxID=486041 RepID=B0DH92_LACBS|nr:uncharacterized protein LACBIDRAFT_302188 [Laccaria bicolor S238N-H82]EDR05974.1 predicted protein [Laccaria bicolor S238N-H82]|eukprot:XP_001883262.1 predicted protein [Laccaria bicolor S238N-H82]